MFNFTIARQHMVESQIRTNDVTHAGVLQAFRKIPRENFIPKSQKALAYGEAHIKIDDERWMVRPRDFSKLIQAARVQDKDIVLDIACGRGYSTAILAQMAETVVGLEDNEERVDRATQELDRAGTLYLLMGLYRIFQNHGWINWQMAGVWSALNKSVLSGMQRSIRAQEIR